MLSETVLFISAIASDSVGWVWHPHVRGSLSTYRGTPDSRHTRAR